MTVYITADVIIKVGALITAIGTGIALLYKFFRWIERHKERDEELKNIKAEQDEELKHIKSEQCLICFALFATLDGLKQLGANGNVTEAYNELEKYLNKSAHDEK